MGFNYTKEKYIAVMELSSSGIKTISAPPFHIRKRHELYKFSDDRKFILNLSNLIDEHQTLDIEAFKTELLPEIIKYYTNIRDFRKPQAFKIVATGYYRTITNSDIVISLIKKAIEERSSNDHFSIELLSQVEESRLAFLAWQKTYKFNAEEKIKFSDTNINKITGLHIDIGGATTEISIVKNNTDFSNTISLLTEITKTAERLLKTKDLTLKIIDDAIYKVGSFALESFASEFKRYEVINYVVVSGSSTIINEEDVNQHENMLLDTRNLVFQIDSLKQTISLKSIKIQESEVLYKRIISLTILKTLLNYSKATSYYSNLANLRIGCFYDMMLKLRQNENPYT